MRSARVLAAAGGVLGPGAGGAGLGVCLALAALLLDDAGAIESPVWYCEEDGTDCWRSLPPPVPPGGDRLPAPGGLTHVELTLTTKRGGTELSECVCSSFAPRGPAAGAAAAF